MGAAVVVLGDAVLVLEELASGVVFDNSTVAVSVASVVVVVSAVCVVVASTVSVVVVSAALEL